MKKIYLLLVLVFSTVILISCGDDSDSNSNQEVVIKAYEKMSSDEAKIKYTVISKTTTIGPKVNNETKQIYKYSKVDNYLYYYYSDIHHKYMTNDNFEGKSDSAGTYYYFIDEAGKYIEAYNFYSKKEYFNTEESTIETDNYSDSDYKILSENFQESKKLFEESQAVDLSEVLTGVMIHIQTLIPIIKMTGNFPSLLETQGIFITNEEDGTVVIRMDLTKNYPENAELNYTISEVVMKILPNGDFYQKSTTELSEKDVVEMGIKTMTTEILYKIGDCEIIYPTPEDYQ